MAMTLAEALTTIAEARRHHTAAFDLMDDLFEEHPGFLELGRIDIPATFDSLGEALAGLERALQEISKLAQPSEQ